MKTDGLFADMLFRGCKFRDRQGCTLVVLEIDATNARWVDQPCDVGEYAVFDGEDIQVVTGGDILGFLKPGDDDARSLLKRITEIGA